MPYAHHRVISIPSIQERPLRVRSRGPGKGTRLALSINGRKQPFHGNNEQKREQRITLLATVSNRERVSQVTVDHHLTDLRRHLQLNCSHKEGRKFHSFKDSNEEFL